MRKSLICTVLTLACFAHAASAAAWAPATFPNPYSDVSRCGRAGLPSRICDPDSVLTLESANVVEGIIKSIEAAKLPFAPSPCPAAAEGGYQVRARMLPFSLGFLLVPQPFMTGRLYVRVLLRLLTALSSRFRSAI